MFCLTSYVNYLDMFNINSFYLYDFLHMISIGYWRSLILENYTPTSFITSVNYFSNFLFIYSFFFNLFFILSIVIGGVLYIGNQGLRLLTTTTSNLTTYHMSFEVFSDIDEEYGSVDDSIVYALCFVMLIVWFFFITTFSAYFAKSIASFSVFVYSIAFMTIFLPFCVFKSFGISFLIYLRGAGRTSSLLGEYILDLLSIWVMMMRFIVQNIRLILLCMAFFDLWEFIFENCDFYGEELFTNIFNFSVFEDTLVSKFYWYDLLSDFIISQLLTFYYSAHIVVSLVSQLSNFVMLFFVVFFFLYTSYNFEVAEKYFLCVKMNKN